MERAAIQARPANLGQAVTSRLDSADAGTSFHRQMTLRLWEKDKVLKSWWERRELFADDEERWKTQKFKDEGYWVTVAFPQQYPLFQGRQQFRTSSSIARNKSENSNPNLNTLKHNTEITKRKHTNSRKTEIDKSSLVHKSFRKNVLLVNRKLHHRLETLNT